MQRVAVLLTALALAGCSSTPAATDTDMTSQPDLAMESPPPDMATPDLAPMIPLITGKVVDKHYLPTTVDNGTTMDQPRDLSAVPVAAYVRDANLGTFITYPGQGKADGTFYIPNVPVDSTFTVRVGSRFILDTQSRAITLGEERLGRPNAPAAVKRVDLILDISNVSPLGDYDDFSLFTPGVDSSMGNMLFNTNDPPFPQDTRIANVAFYFSAFQPFPRLYNNDPAYLVQIAGSLSGNTLTMAALRSLGPTPLTVNDVAGVGGTLRGALGATMQDQSASFDWRRSAFAAGLASAVHPKGALRALDIYVMPRPGGYVRRAPPFNPAVLRLHTEQDAATPPDTTDLKTAVLKYGNPYPAAWAQMGLAEATVTVSGLAFSGFDLRAKIGYLADLDSFKQNPVKPPLSPVQSMILKVPAGDKDLRTTVVNAGVNPTLRWTAPQQGTPDRYQVRIFQRVEVGTNRDLEVANIETTGTEILIPPDVLKPSVNHYLIVRALQGGGPLQAGVPQAWADCVSAVIVP